MRLENLLFTNSTTCNRLKRLTVFSMLLALSFGSIAQCMLAPITLNERVKSSSVIFEGRVKSKHSKWTENRTTIVTYNTVEVYKVFKGKLVSSTIDVVTKGGAVGDDALEVSPSLQLNVGEVGIFTLEPGYKDVSTLVAYAENQGFIKYNEKSQTARAVYDEYDSIDLLYSEIEKITGSSAQMINGYEPHNPIASAVLATPTITSLSPSDVNAGAYELLTINGSNFGTTAGDVSFGTANDGGATYTTATSSLIQSWSNTKITIYVPSGASSGPIQVTNSTAETGTSTDELNIGYNISASTGASSVYGSSHQIINDHVDDNGSGGYTFTFNSTYYANTNAVDRFEEVIELWRCQSGINWTSNGAATTATDQSQSDGINIVVFDDNDQLSAGVLGQCATYSNSCTSSGASYRRITETDVIFNDDDLTWNYTTASPAGSEYDFYSVMLHEMGHGHQLGHVGDDADVMYYSISAGNEKRSLSHSNLSGADFTMSRSSANETSYNGHTGGSIVDNACNTGAMTASYCSNAPSAVFSSNSSGTCSSSLTVDFYDESLDNPSSWLWTFGDGNFSTDQFPTHTYSNAGSYTVSLEATNSHGSSTEEKIGYITVADGSVTAANCNPTSTNAGNFGFTVYNVSFNGIDNSTASITNTAYTDYTCTHVTTVVENTVYVLSVSLNAIGSTYDEECEVWIDYNDDGVFAASEQVMDVTQANGDAGAITANVTIPTTAVTDKVLRMRVVGEANNLSGACETNFIGDAEDYGVYIVSTAPCSPVVITTQPTDSTLCEGSNAQFSVLVENHGGSRWQVNTGSGWSDLSNGGVYTGTGSKNLKITGATTTMDGYEYRYRSRSSTCTEDTSNTVTLNVNGLAAIATQPSNASICDGESTTFSVTASNVGTDKWQVNDGSGWTDLSNGGVYSSTGSKTLSITGATESMDGYEYRYRTGNSNGCGNDTSDVVTLSVSGITGITSQPSDSTICDGLDATFTIAAENHGGVRWMVDDGSGWANLSSAGVYTGAYGTTLTITGATTSMDGYQFRCRTRNSSCTEDTSNVVTLYVNTNGIVTSDPSDQTLCENENTTFTVTGTNVGTDKWQVNDGAGWVDLSGSAIYSGAGSKTLTVTGALTSMDGYEYRYRTGKSNGCADDTSAEVTLTVNGLPNVTSQPSDSSLCDGSNASFTATSEYGGSTVWQVNAGSGWSDVSDGGVYSGSATSTLSITSATVSMDGNLYRLRTQSSTCAPEDTSSSATLSITNGADNAGAITGSLAECVNETNVSYGISTVTGASGYTWTVPAGATIASGTGTNSITVNFGTTSGNVQVTPTSSCGDGSPTSVAVALTAAPSAAGSINGDTVICPNTTGVAYSISAVSGATNYTWSVPGDANITSGQGGTSIVVDFGTSSGNVSVVPDNTCGTGTSSSIAIAVSPLMMFNTNLTNETCTDGNGTITLTVSSGAGSVTHSIDSGATYQSSNAFTNLSGATYDIFIKDSTNCEVSASATIVDLAGPSVTSVAVNDMSCNNVVDGSLVITASGGNGSFLYNLDGGTDQSSATFSSLSQATYLVMVSDTNSCTDTMSATIAEPMVVSYSASITDAVCGASNGSMTLTGSGGNGGSYTYSFNGGAYQSSGSFTNQSGATYAVGVKDVDGCETTSTETINNSGSPTIDSTSFTEPLCNAGTDGTITIHASGGTGAITYSMDNGGSFQAGNSFSTVAAATYTLVIEDANSCQASTPITVTQPTAVSASVSNTNETCGDGNGTITLGGSGGTGSYTYSIDNGGSFLPSGSFASQSAATLNWIVQDVNNCQDTGSEAISNLAGPSLTSVSVTDATCFGNSDGSLTANATGGNGTLAYNIDGGTDQSSATFSSLSQATYLVMVSDTNSCMDTMSATIAEPTVVSYSASITDAVCGASNGSIALTGSGGNGGSYTYSFNGGAYQASGSFINQAAATYAVGVKDVDGCETTSTETINNSGSPTIDSTSFTEPLCNSGNNGTITIHASGGTGAITYSMDNGGSFQAGNSFSTVSAATYTLVIEDANSCQASTPITVTQPTAVSGSVSSTSETCGDGNGTITLGGAGGTGAYTYSIDNGTSFQSSGSFTNQSAATLNWIVQDVNNCQDTGSEAIANLAGPSLTSVSVTDATCFGNSDGSLTANATGGNGTLAYNLDGGTDQSSATFGSLSQATYLVMVSDTNSCTDTMSATIAEPTVVSYSASITDANCGGSNGSITLTGADGNGGAYTYSLNGGTYQSSGVFSSLSAASYTIGIKDVIGCEITSSESVSNVGAPSIDSVDSTDPTCPTDTDGAILISASGGTGALTYSIDNGSNFASTNSYSSLDDGTYNLVVEDASGCQATTSVTLTDPVTITYSSIDVDPLCTDSVNGSITLTVTAGGIGAISYSLDNGGTSQSTGSFSGLSANTFNVLIEDVDGCTASGNIVLANPAALGISNAVVDASCGTADGSITSSGSGGTGSIMYSIDGGSLQSSGSFASLVAGTYILRLEDDNNCALQDTVDVQNPGAPTLGAATTTDPSCFQLFNGSVDVTATGGTGLLSYSMDGGTTTQSTGSFSGLFAGSYTIEVSDSNSCSDVIVFTLTDPAQIVATVSSSEILCFGDANGSISISGSGGTGTLEYSVDGGTTYQATGNFTNLTEGDFATAVKDSNGCIVFADTAMISEPTAIVLNGIVSDVTTMGGTDGSIDLTATGGSGTLLYDWDNDGTGDTDDTEDLSGLIAGFYMITVSDSNNCSSDTTFEVLDGPVGIDELELIGQSIQIYPIPAENNLTIELSGNALFEYRVYNGIGKLVYTGSLNQTTNVDISELASGTYQLVLMDQNAVQIVKRFIKE